MNTDVLFSQKSDVWATPQWLFDALDREFGFTLDPCSDGTNAKCAKFYTPTDSVRKAYGSAGGGATVVCLVPARTDTEWWHTYAMKGEVRLIKGRLKFGDAVNPAPFPSAVIVFRPKAFSLNSWEPKP